MNDYLGVQEKWNGSNNVNEWLSRCLKGVEWI